MLIVVRSYILSVIFFEAGSASCRRGGQRTGGGSRKQKQEIDTEIW